MSKRFGEFFLDPQWPFSCDENKALFSNLRVQEQEDINLVKIDPFYQECHDVFMREFFSPYCEQSQKVNEKDEIFQSSEEENCGSMQNQQKPKIKRQKKWVKYEQEDSVNANIEKKENKKQKQKSKNPLKSFIKRSKQFERGKYKILSEQLKKKIVQESKAMTMVEVSKKYHVSVNNICRWRKRCDRRSGAGRKVTDMQMQSKLLQWLLRQKNPIPRKQVQMMAKRLSHLKDFKASKGWFERFYKRNKLHYNPNIQILTHNDYRQRINQEIEQKSKQKCNLQSMEKQKEKVCCRVKIEQEE